MQLGKESPVVIEANKAVDTNIASYAVDLAAALGTDTVFSLVGGMAMYLNRAVAMHDSLRVVYCQHEQACVAAAEGYAKAANFRKPGLAVVTAGPGVSNTITSLLSAYGDSTPLIILAGQIKTDDIDPYGTRTHGNQEIKSREIITPCVKQFVRISADYYREVLIDVFATCLSGRPGPVFVEIPLDVQGKRVHYTRDDIAKDAAAIRHRVESEVTLGQQSLQDALHTLLEAKRPLLYIGNGCRIAGVEESVVSFAHSFQIPSIFSWLSMDIMPADDPLHFGCPGGLAPISSNQVLSQADVIIFLGARLDLGTTAFQRKAFGGQATRYIVDIDAAELSKFAAFEHIAVVHADLRSLPHVIAQLSSLKSQADPAWLQNCVKLRSQYMAEECERLSSNTMNIYNLTRLISAWTHGQVVVPASSGYAEETLTRFFRAGKGTRFFNGAALGSMGLGLPNALGAAFSAGRRVVCVEADGGIMLNLQELATLAHYAPKGFAIFLLNNHGYESIRVSQSRHFGILAGVDTDSGVFIPSFAKICAAFGLRYISIHNLKGFSDLLPTLDCNAPPVLVDLHIPNFEQRGPGVKTVMSPDGKPSTTPLSEIAW